LYKTAKTQLEISTLKKSGLWINLKNKVIHKRTSWSKFEDASPIRIAPEIKKFKLQTCSADVGVAAGTGPGLLGPPPLQESPDIIMWRSSSSS
jgi:hypothetical protein